MINVCDSMTLKDFVSDRFAQPLNYCKIMILIIIINTEKIAILLVYVPSVIGSVHVI